MKAARTLLPDLPRPWLIAIAAILLTATCAPQFEQERRSSSDTFYRDIKFGMSKAEVKERIPGSFELQQETATRLTYADAGKRKRLAFIFENDRLVMTDHQE